METLPNQDQVLAAIRETGAELGRAPSRSEFLASTGITEYQVLRHFRNWREAVRSAGFQAHEKNLRLDDAVLLRDWGHMVRQIRQIPTREHYRREGNFSVGVFEHHFGPWSGVPDRFRAFAANEPEWLDVLTLLPGKVELAQSPNTATITAVVRGGPLDGRPRHAKLDGRPTYGNPIDFRGLRHEPVNEQGVVFLFGMVARELGYSIEAVQSGFPDCEAKRQVEPGKWQRVRIEFEFESRNFRDHGHPPDGCDVIVCWRHNWSECPPGLEVIPLIDVIQGLSKSED